MINVLTPMARRWLARTLLLTAPLLTAPSWAQQADDPPGRIAYISALEGQVMTAPDASAPWAAAGLNWPITTGTRVATEGSARAELHAGWMALRLQGRSLLDVTRLDDSTAQAALTDGRLSLRLLELPAGQRAEIDTPQLALVADQAGEYRVDVDPGSDTTRITVHSGTATVFGEAGQASTVRAPQQVIFAGRNLNVVQRHNVGPRDALDQWSASRDQLERQSQSARYVSRDMPGYQLLDQYGQWGQDPTYGAVWYPSITVTDWAPYRYGRWTWVAPWGWTWVDDAPWGFAPSHYGRWAQIGPRLSLNADYGLQLLDSRNFPLQGALADAWVTTLGGSYALSPRLWLDGSYTNYRTNPAQRIHQNVYGVSLRRDLGGGATWNVEFRRDVFDDLTTPGLGYTANVIRVGGSSRF